MVIYFQRDWQIFFFVVVEEQCGRVVSRGSVQIQHRRAYAHVQVRQVGFPGRHEQASLLSRREVVAADDGASILSTGLTRANDGPRPSSSLSIPRSSLAEATVLLLLPPRGASKLSLLSQSWWKEGKVVGETRQNNCTIHLPHSSPPPPLLKPAALHHCPLG